MRSAARAIVNRSSELIERVASRFPAAAASSAERRKLRLQLRGKPEQVFCRKRVRNLRGIGSELAEQFRRQDIAARRGNITLLEEMAATTAAGAHQESYSRKFAHVVVDGLPGQVHAPGDAGGGIGFEQGPRESSDEADDGAARRPGQGTRTRSRLEPVAGAEICGERELGIFHSPLRVMRTG